MALIATTAALALIPITHNIHQATGIIKNKEAIKNLNKATNNLTIVLIILLPAMGVVGICATIELKFMRRYVKSTQEQAKAEAIAREQAIATVVHDIRLMLTPPVTNIELIQRHWKTHPERVEGWSKDAMDGIDSVNNLTQDLLLLAKAEAGKLSPTPQPCNLDAIVKSAIKVAENSSDRHIFSFSIFGECEPVSVDRQLFLRAITNLLSNAVKYSPKGGVIHTRLTYHEDSVVILIADQGIGLSEKFAKKQVFNAFERATNTGTVEGTGLGLSIVQACAKAHGGSLKFESREGRINLAGVGAKFNTVFYLKIKKDPPILGDGGQ